MSGEDAFEPTVDEDGEHIGWIAEAEDGALVSLDLDGGVVGAMDVETGESLDPAGYEVVNTGAGEPYPELEQRLEQLEQRVAEPVEFQYERVNDEIDQGRLDNDLANQADYLERALDRPLTLAERRRIAGEAFNDLDAGDVRPDLLAAAARLGDVGEPLRDLDDEHRGRAHEARVAHMAERLQDRERIADAEDDGDDSRDTEPPATQDFYDLDSREQRLDFYADRLRGVTDPDATYSSSDYEEGSE